MKFINWFSTFEATLIENKPAIKVQFFNSKIKSEAIWVSIDYYTGLFKVMILNSGSGKHTTTKKWTEFDQI